MTADDRLPRRDILLTEIETSRTKKKGERILVLAHRGELLDQAEDKLEQATGLKCATEKKQSKHH